MGILKDAKKAYKSAARQSHSDVLDAALNAEPKAAGFLEKRVVGAAGKVGGIMGDKKGALKAGGSKAMGVLKWGAIAAVGAAALAYYSRSGNKRVTPDSLADQPLSPEEIGAITPTLQDDALLQQSQAMAAAPDGNTLMGQEPAPGKWVDTVRGEGPQQLATTATPSIAADEGYQDVVTRGNDSPQPTLAV